jgi:integrase
MAIKAAPLKTDGVGKCTRWHVILYNKDTHKQEWHTILGGKKDAQAFERQEREKMGKDTYVSRARRMTVRQLSEAFILDRESRACRTATIACYKTVLNKHILADDYRFAGRDVGSVRRFDFDQFFQAMRTAGASASTINRALTTAKAMWGYALDRELIQRHPLQRFRPFKRTKNDTGHRVNRGAYSEAEVRALLAAATDHERAFIGLLVLAGPRPGEVYALRTSDLDLAGGAVHIARSWDHRGGVFVEPKTEAGTRTISLAGWLVTELSAHVERLGLKDDALLFSTAAGTPYNPSNVRRDLWVPLRKRAGVRSFDMYSLRHSFATLARTGGAEAFNVSRAIGHARSTLVDQVYAHSLASGMTGVAERVAGRVFDVKPQLRVVGGSDAQDVRKPLENDAAEKIGTAASG